MRAYRHIQEDLEIAEGGGILRRYFVMNGFDGALTSLGIIFGAFIAGLKDPHTLILAGMGASIAMGISGFWIAYLTESAERAKEIKELEDQMITDLSDTEYSEAHFHASIIISFIDGLSPFLFSTISIAPFFFVLLEVIPMQIGYIISFTLVLIEVIVLGLFLGAISEQNKIIYALKTSTAFIAVVLLTFLIEFVAAL
jgi:predicted membrane protein (TIGR00267 family)